MRNEGIYEIWKRLLKLRINIKRVLTGKIKDSLETQSSGIPCHLQNKQANRNQKAIQLNKAIKQLKLSLVDSNYQMIADFVVPLPILLFWVKTLEISITPNFIRWTESLF